MNIIRLIAFLGVMFLSFTAEAQLKHYDIIQKGLSEKGYNEPIYRFTLHDGIYDDQFDIALYGDPDDFPFSSLHQGSVFYQIFSDLMEEEHISMWIYCTKGDHKELVSLYEHGQSEITGLFGEYFENIPYSANKFLYPAFAENKVHLITAKGKTLDILKKEDLKKYKGVYSKQERLSSFVKKDIKKLGIEERENFADAYEDLLTGKIDFVVGSYYKSQIELYKLGLRNFVTLSRTPVWTMPMFMRLNPKTISHPRIKYLKKYLKSEAYKQKRDKALEDMLQIYKENTRGIVPPTYTGSFQSEINTNQNK